MSSVTDVTAASASPSSSSSSSSERNEKDHDLSKQQETHKKRASMAKDHPLKKFIKEICTHQPEQYIFFEAKLSDQSPLPCFIRKDYGQEYEDEKKSVHAEQEWIQTESEINDLPFDKYKPLLVKYHRELNQCEELSFGKRIRCYATLLGCITGLLA